MRVPKIGRVSNLVTLEDAQQLAVPTSALAGCSKRPPAPSRGPCVFQCFAGKKGRARQDSNLRPAD